MRILFLIIALSGCDARLYDLLSTERIAELEAVCVTKNMQPSKIYSADKQAYTGVECVPVPIDAELVEGLQK